MKNLIAYFIVMGMTSNLWASTVPSDKEYFVQESDSYDYIFSQHHDIYMPSIIKLNKDLETVYKKSFNWQLDEHTSLVVASERNQIANAFATIYPNNLTMFYSPGAAMVDYFAANSWIKNLVFHETAHLYQLNAKGGLASTVKNLFGNNLFLWPVPLFWIFPSPNLFTPTYLLEGNSVFNESRFGNGGRLYSGVQRALVYALIRDGLIKTKRLNNDHLEFPYGNEKYMVGGYFTLFLAEQYGTDKVNSFFVKQGLHWWWPIRLNATFEDHFGKSYHQLLGEFMQDLYHESDQQKRNPAKTVISSVRVAPFNGDIGSVFFLTSEDGKEYPTLNILDRNSGQIKKESVDLPISKLFKIKNDYYVSDSDWVSNQELLYSLWGDGGSYLEKYNSKIVNDIKSGDVLLFDAKSSFDKPQLYLNTKKFGEIGSTALWGDDKSVYYFKQDGERRVLYNNRKPLISFDGHYGKLTQIKDGQVYFIASTEYGSSLFVYMGKQIYRLFNSDCIVEAYNIKGDEFIIAEVGSKGYSYKITKSSQRRELPFRYHYFFERSKDYKRFKDIIIAQESVTRQSAVEKKSYNYLTNLRFSSLDLSYRYATGNIDSSGFAALTLVDPLMYNSIYLKGSFDDDALEDELIFQYKNDKHLLGWFYLFSYQYDRSNYAKRYYKDPQDTMHALGVSYPLVKNKRWDLSLRSFIFAETDADSDFGYYGGLKLNWGVDYALSMYSYRKFQLHTEWMDSDDGEEGSISAKVAYDVGWETIFGPKMICSYSNTGELEAGTTIEDLGVDFIPAPFNLYASPGDALYGGKAGASLTKVINWSFYFASFPISLRRLAPSIAFYEYFYKKSGWTSNSEVIFSITPELLVANKFPFQISFEAVERQGAELNRSYGLYLKAQY